MVNQINPVIAKLLPLMQDLLHSGQDVPLDKAPLIISDRKNQVVIELHSQIGETSDHEKKLLEREILQLIDICPEFQVIGTYTARNIYSRPENTFIFIRPMRFNDLSSGQICLNIAPKKQIIYFGHPNAPKETLPWLISILQQFPHYFLFGSGQKFTEAVINGLDIDTKLHNITYALEDLIRPSRMHLDLRVVIFNEQYLHTMSNPQELDQLKAFNDYADTSEELVARIRKNPHVLGYLNGIPVGCARTNELTDHLAVIGGVKTLLSYRHQKVGITICYAFFDWLISQHKQIVLETDVDNFPARQIYEGLGFKQTGHSLFIDNQSGVLREIIGDRDY